MKIGLYIFSLAFGGAERVVSRLSSILESHGHIVYIILDDLSSIQYEYSGTLLTLGIPHNVRGMQSIKNMFARMRRLRQLKARYEFDVVVSFLFMPNLINIFSRTGNCKIFVSIRNHFLSHKYDSVSSIISYLLAKKYYKKADGVICVSELVKSDAVRYLNVPDEKTFVLYNPYDAQEIKREAEINNRNMWINQESKNAFVFVSTGRHTRQKGVWHLIKAFYLLSKGVENIRLVLIGDGESRAKIENLINELGIKDKVILTGFQKDVFSIEKQCAAYVMSSIFEGFPNALVEAMCLGLPVISADCKSGPREILAPDTSIYETTKTIEMAEFGILVSPLESDENWSHEYISEGDRNLADAMKLMLKNDVSDYYSKQSVKRASAFSFDSCYESFIDIIK